MSKHRTPDRELYRFRQRTLTLAKERGNVRAACQAIGIHHSTFCRWRRDAERDGLEMLSPRERHPPRMPNATGPFVEQRVVAFALGQPGFGPARIAAERARPKVGRHEALLLRWLARAAASRSRHPQ